MNPETAAACLAVLSAPLFEADAATALLSLNDMPTADATSVKGELAARQYRAFDADPRLGLAHFLTPPLLRTGLVTSLASRQAQLGISSAAAAALLAKVHEAALFTYRHTLFELYEVPHF